MIYEPSTTAFVVFGLFVGVVLGLSFWLGRRAKSAGGYFAAHGEIHWFVNGVAFAGDYLSAASFLGICGMIAFYGYDGFLYSIGYLAGWIVALFVVAEPMKRLGRYTFADALDNRFRSRGIKLAAALSTLVVSVFYLIPQMVGAGTLVRPLLGLSHEVGVVVVGVVVILIVATAGMVSTTYVQFIKGALLVVCCAILTVMILRRGIEVATSAGHPARSTRPSSGNSTSTRTPGGSCPATGGLGRHALCPVRAPARAPASGPGSGPPTTPGFLSRAQTLTVRPDGSKLVERPAAGQGRGQGRLLPRRPRDPPARRQVEDRSARPDRRS